MNILEENKKLKCALKKCKNNAAICPTRILEVTQIGFQSSNDGFILSVKDENNNLVSGYTTNDFLVWENGGTEFIEVNVIENNGVYEFRQTDPNFTFTNSYNIILLGYNASTNFVTNI